MAEALTLNVTVKRSIAKYAEGADPAVDEPISVDVREVNLTGNEAEQALKEIGISKEAAIDIASSIKGGNV